jgi:hypothetical protein
MHGGDRCMAYARVIRRKISGLELKIGPSGAQRVSNPILFAYSRP